MNMICLLLDNTILHWFKIIEATRYLNSILNQLMIYINCVFHYSKYIINESIQVANHSIRFTLIFSNVSYLESIHLSSIENHIDDLSY